MKSFLSTRKDAVFALLLGLLTVTGTWLLYSSTPTGLGLTDDAISYISAARALLGGQGFTRIWLATGLEPVTHWPPLFSALMAVTSSILEISPYRSARFINILVFGANAGIIGFLGWKMTHSRLAGIFLSLLFLSNSTLLRLHAQALSEPLYLFISLLAFLTFYRAVEFRPRMGVNAHAKFIKSAKADSPEQPTSVGFVFVAWGLIPMRGKWLILAGILTGLSYLTRYAALSLFATFIVAILLLRPSWKKRFSSLGYFLAGALPVMLAWMLRNKLVGGSATNRAIEWHPVTGDNAQRGLRAFFRFIIPQPELCSPYIEKPLILAIITSLITLVLFLWIIPRGLKYFLKPKENTRPEILSFITTLYIFTYMGSLLISLNIFDAATPLNDRILSPVYLACLVILVYFIHWVAQQGKITARIIAFGIATLFLGIAIGAQIRTVEDLQESAHGFASWRWRESTVMVAVRELPEDTAIYTNQPPAVYFWTDRPVYRLWDEQPEALRSGDAVLAIFWPVDDKSPEFQAWLDEMTDGLVTIEKSGLGYLYQAQP
ncbi:MAG: hypothetical protein ISR59_03600 [Anaerolineales bacterium]|uniref:Uncharacterized protein n=1 Tax=Candidatus Desulfolinea nitratireducens TaxID=2841698 RepID=A0A8J6NI46_9CHLR|nr:hypothetical protein [Candidatus Desulfolinea nitratireducens]MBL6960169.1 hypothetical protein [Anaerolineales bacterium]